MHINDSLCPSPMQWGGWGRDRSPALMQGTGGQCILVLLPDALWPCVGMEAYSPFLLALVALYQVSVVELWWGSGGWQPQELR